MVSVKKARNFIIVFLLLLVLSPTIRALTTCEPLNELKELQRQNPRTYYQAKTWLANLRKLLKRYPYIGLSPIIGVIHPPSDCLIRARVYYLSGEFKSKEEYVDGLIINAETRTLPPLERTFIRAARKKLIARGPLSVKLTELIEWSIGGPTVIAKDFASDLLKESIRTLREEKVLSKSESSQIDYLTRVTEFSIQLKKRKIHNKFVAFMLASNFRLRLEEFKWSQDKFLMAKVGQRGYQDVRIEILF